MTKILDISSDNRTFTAGGERFFMLGDTAWLLACRLNREEVLIYLDDRKNKGFNTVLFSVIHGSDENIYGKKAFSGKLFENPSADEPDGFWNHIDFIVEEAGKRGIYCGMIPAWGSAHAAMGTLNTGNAPGYARFLAKRYATLSVFWVLGGDVRGTHTALWDAMGEVFLNQTRNQLITYHPFGRTRSSAWFHDRKWLMFNMYQSGHRRYDQMEVEGSNDNEVSASWFGEDNWRYAEADLSLSPPKPTLDGEPSYEDIPQGLHVAAQPRWSAKDARRFAWWSVLAGAAGHIYGHNSVMQFLKPQFKAAFFADKMWDEGMSAPGSAQMRYVKEVWESLPPGHAAQDLVIGNGDKHHRVSAFSGDKYAVFYSFLGEPFRVKGKWDTAIWLNPETGERTAFTPSGALYTPPVPGNDVVLILKNS